MKITKCATRYAKQANWVDLGLLKVCVGSVGVIIGLCLPKEGKKTALAGASVAFSLAFCPLIYRFFKSVSGDRRK